MCAWHTWFISYFPFHANRKSPLFPYRRPLWIMLKWKCIRKIMILYWHLYNALQSSDQSVNKKFVYTNDGVRGALCISNHCWFMEKNRDSKWLSWVPVRSSAKNRNQDPQGHTCAHPTSPLPCRVFFPSLSKSWNKLVFLPLKWSDYWTAFQSTHSEKCWGRTQWNPVPMKTSFT